MGIFHLTLPSGFKMAYRESGKDGATKLVQIHGLGTGHQNFDLLTPELAHAFHIHDVDLPGYGDSESGIKKREIPEFAASVAQFIESKEIGPVHVHGTSMGGCIAMMLAAERPELVDKLVVSCSFAKFDRASHMIFETWKVAADAGAKALAVITSQQGFSRTFWDRPESETAVEAFVQALSGMSPEEFLRDLVAIENLDISEKAARIRAKTMLLGADEDIMTPVVSAPSGYGMTDLHRLITGSQLEIITNCGHFIAIERPEETARKIEEFLMS